MAAVTTTIATAPTALTRVSASVCTRDWRRSVLRVAAQQAELQHGEDEDDREQHPRHGRRGAELKEVLKRRLVQMLDDRARGVARPAHGQHEHLTEDLK